MMFMSSSRARAPWLADHLFACDGATPASPLHRSTCRGRPHLQAGFDMRGHATGAPVPIPRRPATAGGQLWPSLQGLCQVGGPTAANLANPRPVVPHRGGVHRDMSCGAQAAVYGLGNHYDGRGWTPAGPQEQPRGLSAGEGVTVRAGRRDVLRPQRRGGETGRAPTHGTSPEQTYPGEGSARGGLSCRCASCRSVCGWLRLRLDRPKNCVNPGSE